MTDFESLPDIPEPSGSSLESNESGSVIFGDAPFPSQEEVAEIQGNGDKANQWAWIIAIVALLFLCLCCFGVLAVTLIATRGTNEYLYEILNEVFVYVPFAAGL